ncbi:NDR1/HIN1-like protein 10 [Phragmites australis]|uniref:NDR1/HIN1-like protein 10 n=1 Tax=Phragmites australis TaxID=29695 RepID=UPI002D7734C9|nr:NDR1/HIN1-like protein 10 [Phragmites australis]
MGAWDDCCDDCCYSWKDFWWCVLCLAIFFVVAIIVILVVAFGFIRHIDITVDDASLTRLALVNTTITAFAYNLTLTLTIRNPNWAMNMMNTKPLEAAYNFDGQQFDRVRLADEGDKHPAGKTRVYRLTSGSDSAFVSLGNAGVAEFKKENATGTFEVEVALTGEVKYTARVTKCKIEATCPLKLQLASSGEAPAALVFQKVKCKLAKPEKNC